MGGLWSAWSGKEWQPSWNIFDTDLQHGEAGLLCKSQLFCVARIGVVAVVVQPLLEDLDRVFGQVTPAPPGGGAPAPALLVLSAAGVSLPLVCAGAGVPLPFSH